MQDTDKLFRPETCAIKLKNDNYNDYYVIIIKIMTIIIVTIIMIMIVLR